MKANQPIGIFDSGIGGLTVANAIRRILPKENLIYFGDTAHLPYGDKSASAIRHYSHRIADFLLEKKCKTVIIACNTASSVAFNTTKKHVGENAVVMNVIDPVTSYVAVKYPKGKIGVIGTKGTINSRVYVRRINKLNEKLNVTSLATPLLAPMIEEGFFNNYISRTIINNYLSKNSIQHINALILACTHYPLIKKEVHEYYQKKTEIIDSAEIVAKAVKTKLTKKKLLSSQATSPKHRFFVSDYTKAFEESTRIFFKGEIHLRKADIWG
ncbi:MAG: glutamate racemase [Flavobacteriales bacterium]|nr:MAG: glutamate racemase [Flavobacteriales bacterium]